VVEWSIIPVICRETAAELLRVLNYAKFRLSAEDLTTLLALYIPFAEVIVLSGTLPLLNVECRDPKDEVFLHLALTAKADFLVSGDDDLTSLVAVGTIPIISAEAFRNVIAA